MKSFPIRGGIHPSYHKELASEEAIRPLPIPAKLFVPLQQHVGAAAVPIVRVGDTVSKGQLLAKSGGNMSATVHSPTSGRVVDICDYLAPHASGLPQPTVILETDGKETWCKLPDPIADPFSATPEEIVARVSESGVVGQGGAVFPTSVKLAMTKQYKLDTLLLNGAECEPYVTSDDRVMREYAAEMIDGARIMAHALGVPNIIIAIKKNKPKAIEIVTEAARAYPEIKVTGVKIQYPIGYAQYLTQAVTGRETPADHRNAEVGVITQNVATALAVHRAVRHGRPLLSRVVTVTGAAIRKPANLEVMIGTPISALIEECGGFKTEPRYLINGGPMMGYLIPGIESPVVKGCVGIVAMAEEEVIEHSESPCVRCGSCVDVCPIGLAPAEMAMMIRKDRLDDAANLGVRDCIACGSCAWACPSHIPLLQYFNHANGALWTADKQSRKNDRLKTLAEAKQQRVEKAAQERIAAQAARKAQRAAAATTATEE